MKSASKKSASPGPAHGAGSDRRLGHGWLLAVLAAATVAAFHHVLFCDFVNWDDDLYVRDNVDLRSGLSGAGVWWALTCVLGGFWIPLTWLSLLLDYQLYGLRPWGFHLTNLLLHAGNVVLAFVLIRRWTGQPGRALVAAAL